MELGRLDYSTIPEIMSLIYPFSGDDEERKSFRAKGIPVIFQDEYEEKPEIGNKSPVILKDEKPPLLPPSYNTSNMNGGFSVLY